MSEAVRLLQQANNARRLAAVLTDRGAYDVLMTVAAECEALVRDQQVSRRIPAPNNLRHAPRPYLRTRPPK